MTARNCIVLLFFVLLACGFTVSAAQNNYWQQQQWQQQQQQMQQRQMQQQQEMMRRQQEQMRQQQQMEQMRRQQMLQQQQRILQQQRASQASGQARAAQQKAIRDQDKRRQFSQRQNVAQKLQQQKAMEQNNRLKTQRRLTQQRLVQQKILQKNRQEQEKKNRDIGVLALIGSAPGISMSPQLSERIRNVTQKSANDNNPTKVTAGNTGNINRPSGKKTGNGDSGRPSFKLTKVFNQSAKPLPKDVALRLMTLDAKIKKESTTLSKSTIVLGHYPRYVFNSAAGDYERFSIKKSEWEKLNEEERWNKNKEFLDTAIKQSKRIVLSTPENQVKDGSFYQRELDYMYSKGYKLSSDGKELVKE